MSARDNLKKSFLLGAGVNTYLPADSIEDKASRATNLCSKLFPDLSTRPGTSLHSTLPGSGAVHGLFVFGHPRSSVTPILVAGRGGIGYVYNAGSWAAVSGASGKNATALWDAVNFGSALIITNGVDKPFNIHKDTAYHSDVLSSAPIGSFITADANRVFVADKFLLSWSKLNDATNWTATGVDGAGSQTLSPDTNYPITGMSNYGGVTLYREGSLSEMVGLPNSLNVEIIDLPASYGSIAQHSITQFRESQYFWSKHGLAKYLRGLSPNIISEPAKYWVDQLSLTVDTKVCSHIVGDRELWVAIPTGSSTVPDTVLVYDLEKLKWYIYQGPWTPITFVRFNNEDYLVSSDAKVYKINSGTDDAGTAVAWTYVSEAHRVGAEIRLKRIVVTSGSGSFSLQYSVVRDAETWSSTVAVSPSSAGQKMKVAIPPTSADVGYGDYFRLKLTGSGPVTVRGAYLQYRVRSI